MFQTHLPKRCFFSVWVTWSVVCFTNSTMWMYYDRRVTNHKRVSKPLGTWQHSWTNVRDAVCHTIPDAFRYTLHQITYMWFDEEYIWMQYIYLLYVIISSDIYPRSGGWHRFSISRCFCSHDAVCILCSLYIFAFNACSSSCQHEISRMVAGFRKASWGGKSPANNHSTCGRIAAQSSHCVSPCPTHSLWAQLPKRFAQEPFTPRRILVPNHHLRHDTACRHTVRHIIWQVRDFLHIVLLMLMFFPRFMQVLFDLISKRMCHSQQNS